MQPSVITELFFVVYNLMFTNIVRHNNQEQANRKDRPQRTLHLSGLEFYRTDNGADRETKELIKRRAFRSDWLLFTGEGAWGAGGQGAGESRESGRSDSSPPLPSLTAFNYLPNNKNEQLSQWFRENPLKVIRFIDLL